MKEHMTRQRFWALSEEERGVWRRRLFDQWGCGPESVLGFWFDGESIIGAALIKRDGEGRPYAIGNEIATELVGVRPDLKYDRD